MHWDSLIWRLEINWFSSGIFRLAGKGVCPRCGDADGGGVLMSGGEAGVKPQGLVGTAKLWGPRGLQEWFEPLYLFP